MNYQADLVVRRLRRRDLIGVIVDFDLDIAK